MNKLFYFGIVFFLLIAIPNVSSVCVGSPNKINSSSLERVTFQLNCSEATEKSKSFNAYWNNGTNATSIVKISTGTTPSTTGQNFYIFYDIPSSETILIDANVSLSGTNLEGISNTFNVSGASSNSILITNPTFGGLGYIGLVSSIFADTTDTNGKKLTGGYCKISVWSNDESEMLLSLDSKMMDGKVKFSAVGTADRFTESTPFAYKIICSCGSNNSETECQDEDGNTFEYSVGSTKSFFISGAWLSVNTVTDKSEYFMKNEISICANVTNLNYSYRIPLHIFHQVRCSSGSDNNNDLDRRLIVSDDEHPDDRGISTNTTQMQCKSFIIPESKYLQGRTSQCYASTNVQVLDSKKISLFTYSTTSPVFNITSDELNLYPDWQRLLETKINSIINLSKDSYDDYNGVGIGNIDLKLNSVFGTIDSTQQYDISPISLINIINMKYIKNWTVYNQSADLTDSAFLEFLEDGSVELEIRDINLSSMTWLNVTINFNSWEERDANANEDQAIHLENISAKTGTFHFDVDCPEIGDKRENMVCKITAFVEEKQIVEKEVDFTCYIYNNNTRYSELNWNDMITRDEKIMLKEFYVSDDLPEDEYITMRCEAGYYNLGSRVDTFSDSFFITDSNHGGIDLKSIGAKVEDFLGFKGILFLILLTCAFGLYFFYEFCKSRDIDINEIKKYLNNYILIIKKRFNNESQ